MINVSKFLGLIFISILLAGCSGCNEKLNKTDKAKLKQKSAPAVKVEEKPVFDTKVPDACSLLTIQEISAAIGVDQNSISTKDGSNTRSLTVRSCFFRWEHHGVPNSGVLVQAQSNPLPEDFPTWATTYIKSKIDSGEKSMEGEVFLYKPFNGGGVEGAYNHAQSKYFWRMDDQLIYTITFNLGEDEATQLAWAEKIAAYVNN